MADTKNGESKSADVVSNEPISVTFADVTSAPYRIRDGVPQTPCENDLLEIFKFIIMPLVMIFEWVTAKERIGNNIDNAAQSRLKDALRADIQSKSNEVDILRERIATMEREIREKDSQIEQLRSRGDQTEESLALNTMKVANLELQRSAPQFTHDYNGTLLWKIEGFRKKRQAAINGSKMPLYSPSFYTAQYGYKMCAKMYITRDEFGKGLHLSLLFVVMKGDYDALLTWPFQKKITMTLLNQGNGDHMFHEFHSDPQSSSFQRPKSDINLPSGPVPFKIDHSNNGQYIKDDVMFIKIVVD